MEIKPWSDFLIASIPKNGVLQVERKRQELQKINIFTYYYLPNIVDIIVMILETIILLNHGYQTLYFTEFLQIFRPKMNPGLKVALLILGWYLCSITLGLYNTALFSAEHYNFKYPFLATAFHSASHFTMAILLLHMNFGNNKEKLRFPGWSNYITKIFPCGLTTALDIGLSNSSVKSITLSFYTMIKSGAPVFILLFAILFKLEAINLRLIVSIIVICTGVVVMVMSELKFDLRGYIEVQLATIISGLRWTLVQLLLKDSNLGLDHPIKTIMMIAPTVFACLLFGGIFVEGLEPFLTALSENQTLILAVFGGSFLAFLMVLVEFELVRSTSAVTLSVAGIFKEILTISFSVLFFKDLFSLNTIVGLVVSLIGICMYNYYRLYEKDKSVDGYSELDMELSDFELDFSVNDRASATYVETNEMDIDEFNGER